MSLAKLYRLGVIGLMALGVPALGTFFVLGPDPAVLTRDESEDLRDELKELRSVASGEFVDLNDRSTHRWILGPGFAPPEADGAWVRAKRAEMIFYLSAADVAEGTPLSFELSVSPLLLEGQTARPLTLRSAIEEVTVELAAGGSRIFVEIPANTEQVVELVCDSLDSPSQEQSSIDARRLCVKVYGMAVWRERRSP